LRAPDEPPEAERHIRWCGRWGQATAPGDPINAVSELRQPGEKPLRWVLLTNLTEPVLSVVGRYLERWKIERLFYFEKVGFRLECWHQEAEERIARRLLLVQIAASAVYQLSQATDENPSQPLALLDVLDTPSPCRCVGSGTVGIGGGYVFGTWSARGLPQRFQLRTKVPS